MLTKKPGASVHPTGESDPLEPPSGRPSPASLAERLRRLSGPAGGCGSRREARRRAAGWLTATLAPPVVLSLSLALILGSGPSKPPQEGRSWADKMEESEPAPGGLRPASARPGFIFSWLRGDSRGGGCFSTSVYRLVGSARAGRRAPRRCLCLSVAGRCSGSGPVRFRSAGSAGSRLPNTRTELSP